MQRTANKMQSFWTTGSSRAYFKPQSAPGSHILSYGQRRMPTEKMMTMMNGCFGFSRLSMACRPGLYARTGPDYDFFYYDFTAFFLRFYGVFLRFRYDASGAFTTLPSHVFTCFQA